MASDLTRDWLKNVLRPYPSHERILGEVMAVLAAHRTLAVKTDAFTFDSGQTALLLLLHGTLPINYRGATYQIPINVWIPHEYPRRTPMMFVVPTKEMGVRKSREVDPGGRVRDEAVDHWWASWPTQSRDLTTLLTKLAEIFSLAPPVYAKPPEPARSSTTPSRSTPPHQSQPSPLHSQPPPHHSHTLPPTRPYSNGDPLPMYAGGPTRQASLPMSDRDPGSPPVSGPGPGPGSPPVPLRPGQVPPLPSRPAFGPPGAQQALGSPVSSSSGAPWQQGPPVPPAPFTHGQQPPPPPPPPPSHPVPPAMPQGMPPQGYPPHRYQQQQMWAQSPPPVAPHPQQPQPQQPQQHLQPVHSGPQQPQYAGPPPDQYGQPYPAQRPPIPPNPHPKLQPPAQPAYPSQPLAQATSHRTPDLLSSSSPEAPITSLPDPGAPPLPPSKPPPPSVLHLHAVLLPHLTASLPPLMHSLHAQKAQLVERREDLATGEPAIRDEMARLEAVKKVCDAVGGKLEAVVSAGEGRLVELEGRGDVSVDEVVCGISIVHNQLIDLVAEDNALSDTMYHLTRALEAERIDLDRYLKAVRSLSREQYMKRALIERINEGMGQASWSS